MTTDIDINRAVLGAENAAGMVVHTYANRLSGWLSVGRAFPEKIPNRRVSNVAYRSVLVSSVHFPLSLERRKVLEFLCLEKLIPESLPGGIKFHGRVIPSLVS